MPLPLFIGEALQAICLSFLIPLILIGLAFLFMGGAVLKEHRLIGFIIGVAILVGVLIWVGVL
jgi:hypothetical protein